MDHKKDTVMKKNDMAVVVIEDMSENGEGIGRSDGYTLFIKDTVIGDRAEVKVIKAKKTYGYGRLVRLLEPSPWRTEPLCPAAAPCGGCQLQAMSYEQQLKFKEKKVRNHLERLGGFPSPAVHPVIGMEEPWHYRNKAQFPVARDREGRIIMGFYAGRTHAVIQTPHCYIGHPVNERVLDAVRAYMEENRVEPYDEAAHRGLVRHVLIRRGAATGEVMVCLIINGKRLPAAERLTERLLEISGMTSISYNINREKTNVILGEQVIDLYGPGYITDRIGDLTFRISPQSFFQVNPVQTRILYEKALAYAGLTGEETVWDLYCGAGTISLFLARKAKRVYGVEIVPQAVENARENARINGIENVEFYTGKAEELMPELNREGRLQADVVVVDPPRKGCAQSLLDTVIDMNPRRVVYVSCNSATLARDLRYLCDRGFRLEEVQPVDMFPMTVGVETVVLLSKGEIDSKKVRVEFSLEDMDMSGFQKGATYEQIKAYVLEHTGLKVSSLYISQIKRKCGLDVGQNYNLSKKEDAKVPKCPPEKEAAIIEALKYFGMI